VNYGVGLYRAEIIDLPHYPGGPVGAGVFAEYVLDTRRAIDGVYP